MWNMQTCMHPWEGGILTEMQTHCCVGKAHREPTMSWDRPVALLWGDTASHCSLVWFALPRWGLLTVHCAGRCQCGVPGKGERNVPRLHMWVNRSYMHHTRLGTSDGQI